MTRICSIAFVLALSFAGTASASVHAVFQRSLLIDRSINIFTTSEFDLNFVFADALLAPTDPVILFSGLTLSPADVGRTFVADAKTDRAFADAALRITDSLDQFVQIILTEASSGRAEKRGFRARGFFSVGATTGPPDLVGSVIDSITLSIDKFILTPAASLPALGSDAPVQLQMTFTVMAADAPAAVPEPSSLLAWAGLGIASVIAVRATRWLGSR
jgi:hypothetical protein